MKLVNFQMVTFSILAVLFLFSSQKLGRKKQTSNEKVNFLNKEEELNLLASKYQNFPHLPFK